MITGNRISEEIPQSVINAVLALFVQADGLLKPYYANLSKEDKIHMAKVDDKTVPFLEKGSQYAGSNPEFLAPRHDAAELVRDVKLFSDANQMLIPGKQFVEQLEKIATLAGSDAYFTIRSYYKSVQQAAAEGDAKAKPIYNELKKRFEGMGKTATKA